MTGLAAGSGHGSIGGGASNLDIDNSAIKIYIIMGELSLDGF